MNPISIPTVVARARQLRAEDLQSRPGLFAERRSLYTVLLGHSLLSLLDGISAALQPLFSWNPQVPAASHGMPSRLIRINRIGRALFAWNPQRRRAL